MNFTPPDAGRDPVCEAIESLLFDLEAHGTDKLKKYVVGNRIHLEFGGIQVESITLDIALVRLANAMMDDVRYCMAIQNALRGPMLAERVV